MPLKCKNMAEKQDIAMNAFKVLTDVTYLYGEASDSSQGKIKKSDLLSEVFQYRGSLSQYDDTSLKIGFYIDLNNATDRPSNFYEYGMLLVFPIGKTMIFHVHISTRSIINFRVYSSGKWGEWKSVTLT